MLEEEIDLRPYIIALVEKWWVIVIMAIVGFLVASFFIFSTEPEFSATAIVTVQDAQDLIEIDSSISDLQVKQPLDAFPELALSDEVLADTLLLLDLNETVTISDFRESLNSEAGSDDSVIRLTTSSESPILSAETSNAWANAFTDWANSTYAGRNNQQVQFFNDQLGEAKLQLELAEEAIEAFEIIDESITISNTLGAYSLTHLSYVRQKLQIGQVINDSESLRAQIENRPANLDVTLSDQLAFLQLQLSSLNEESQLPLIVDVANSDLITSSNRDEQLIIINGFIQTLEDDFVRIDNLIEEIGPQILELQQKRYRFLSERKRLLRDWEIINEIVRVLIFQVAEERIASQNQSDGFQIASRAVATAVTSTQQNSNILSIIGAFFGISSGIFFVLISHWWRKV